MCIIYEHFENFREIVRRLKKILMCISENIKKIFFRENFGIFEIEIEEFLIVFGSHFRLKFPHVFVNIWENSGMLSWNFEMSFW